MSRVHFDRLRVTVGEVLANWQTPSDATTRACAAFSDLRHYGAEVAPTLPDGVLSEAFRDAHGRALVLTWLTRVALLNHGERYAATDLLRELKAVATSEAMDAGGDRAAFALARVVGVLEHYLAALAIEAAASTRTT
jgi:hypothetical protein